MPYHPVSTSLGIPAFRPSNEQIKIAQICKVDPLIVILLEQKNIRGAEEIQAFLSPALSDLPDPFSMKGMEEAADIVLEAIGQNFEIIIWGDYDVDGVTGTALLLQFFKKLGVAATYHIPNRFKDGYGLNHGGLLRLKKKVDPRRSLIITVDCGISNEREILAAKELGFRIIITDHHEPERTITVADAVLNPKQGGMSLQG